MVTSVDKSFVYPNMPEGWVRVRGYENFERAYSEYFSRRHPRTFTYLYVPILTFLPMTEHLNGYNHNGTVMSASTQNEHHSIYIWDMRVSPQAAGYKPSLPPVGAGAAAGGGEPGPSFEGGGGGGPGGMGYYAMPASGSLPSADYGGAYYSGYGDAIYPSSNGPSSYPRPAFSSPSSAEGSAMGMASGGSDGAHVAAGGGTDQAASWYTPYTAGVDGATYGSQYGNYYGNHYASQYTGQYAYASQPYYYYDPASSSAMVPVPKTYKVFVKNLSRHATHDELDAFLVAAAGGRHKLVERVRFPRSTMSLTGTARQHAFLLFRNHGDALAALNRLQNSKLKGLAVEARFANEIVMPPVDSAGTGSHGDGGNHGDSGSATPTPETPASSSARPGLSPSHNLVVDGSSDYGRAKQAEEARKSKNLK